MVVSELDRGRDACTSDPPTPKGGLSMLFDSKLPVRFWSKVRADVCGCWLWVASLDSHGYGQIGMGGRLALVHRLAYEDLVGPIPDGLTIDHLCRTPPCLNPCHLEPVTLRVNIMRGTNVSSRNARKAHCPNGHPYDIFEAKARRCRKCRQAIERRASRRYRARRAAG